VKKIRFRHIFGPELFGRLGWFGRLRWLAVIGLAVASFLGARFGFPSVWPSLFVVASVVGAYNLASQLWLHGSRQDHPLNRLRNIALGLTVLDLAALMVTIHFTGGLQSPLLPFFAFHMAIGTIMFASWTYVLAGGVSLGLLLLLVLEARGVLRFHPLIADHVHVLHIDTAALNLLTLVVALFGIVYLTDSVVRRLKTRSIELYEATHALSERGDELQRLLKEMEDLERRKSHYMRISAHQLRSPLGTIKTVLDVLTQGHVDPSSERGRTFLSGAEGVADSLLAVVNDLLDLARLREGRSRALWKNGVNVNQLLADLFDSLVPDAEQRQVELVADFRGVAVLAWGVPPDLVHAFENLIYNGVKYSRPGGQVTVRLRIEGDTARIDIADRGIGIPEDYADQVFLEFVRAPNAKRFAREGTGLGLAIVKEVVETHGGSVSVASGDGEGSTFTVRLKLDHSPPEVERALQAGNGSGYDADTGPGDSASD